VGEESTAVTVRYLISGRVQGVGFRYFVARLADALALAGWTRNLPDGRVEVVARGEASKLGQLEEVLRTGPRSARVSAVDKFVISDEIADVNGFEIR
jgi:acylphosphatase